jgi:hypothetical protein
MPSDIGLVESISMIRKGRALPQGTKLLVVLDQFEQWLHSNRGEQGTELVSALRQCDGGLVQAVVMVRDDFWLAASRFMQELEIRAIEGENSSLVDLFDVRHAKKVLAAFGRAYGALPEEPNSFGDDHVAFLERAVSDITEDGKVVPVRLALFAEMVKGRPWTPATLKHVGGSRGVGVTFLEETFCSRAAPAEHRLHQAAARAVLSFLLPGRGADIKGHMRPYEELLEASGYADMPDKFDDLLRILDGELRLISPADPGSSPLPDGTQKATPGRRHFQLTHDYLVHSLREWLYRKQSETRRGRAEIRLARRGPLGDQCDLAASAECVGVGQHHDPDEAEGLDRGAGQDDESGRACPHAEICRVCHRIRLGSLGRLRGVRLNEGVRLGGFARRGRRRGCPATREAVGGPTPVGGPSPVSHLPHRERGLKGATARQPRLAAVRRHAGRLSLRSTPCREPGRLPGDSGRLATEE